MSSRLVKRVLHGNGIESASSVQAASSRFLCVSLYMLQIKHQCGLLHRKAHAGQLLACMDLAMQGMTCPNRELTGNINLVSASVQIQDDRPLCQR